MRDIPIICSFNGLELTILAKDGKEEVINVPVAAFFQRDDEILYLAAPYTEGVKAHPIPTGIVRGRNAQVKEETIKGVLEHHLKYVAGVECSEVKKAVCDGEDIIRPAAKMIRQYSWC